MATRIDFDRASLEALGLSPWYFRCKFTLDFTVREENPDWGVVQGVEQWLGVDLTGATVRWVLLAAEGGAPTAYDFEKIHGGAGDAHVTFPDVTEGEIRISLTSSDSTVAAGTAYWYQLLIELPGDTRELYFEGRLPLYPAADVTVAVDPSV